MLKAGLCSIYTTAGNALEARTAFRRWATAASVTGSRELIAMAKTIREKLHGIITYWTFDKLSNAPHGRIQQQDPMAHPPGIRLS